MKKATRKQNTNLKEIEAQIRAAEKHIFSLEQVKSKAIGAFKKRDELERKIKDIERDYQKKGNQKLLGMNLSYRSLKKEFEPYKSVEKFNTRIQELNEKIIKQNSILTGFQKRHAAIQNEIETENRRKAEKQLKNVIKAEQKRLELLERRKERKRLEKKLDTPRKVSTFEPHHYAPQVLITEPSIVVRDTTDDVNVAIPWNDISFEDGFLLVRYNRLIFRKKMQECRHYLNKIKDIYIFRNVPELQVVLSKTSFISIQNPEILFYHISFLKDAKTLFDSSDKRPSIAKWKKYTKKFYKEHLKFAFQTESLSYLCEASKSDYPIIPVGELVKTSSGSKQVHSSFLFPIETRMGISIVWESIEESKATYIFHVEENFERKAQKIFDYLVGEMTNKRATLINSEKLQQELDLRKRVMHNDFSKWVFEINLFQQHPV